MTPPTPWKDPEVVERGKPFTFAITGDFGKQGGKTEGATVHVSILYDLGKKVPDEYASQMRLKGMDVEQLHKHTSLRILNHERPIGTINHGHLTQQSDKSVLPEHLPEGAYIIRYIMHNANYEELVCLEVEMDVE